MIQTAGRAARHIAGCVILYADEVTDSMRRMIEVTDARRARQLTYNSDHGITPTQIVKGIQESLAVRKVAEEAEEMVVREAGADYDVQRAIADMEKEMLEAAAALEFERAAILRDQIHELKGVKSADKPVAPQTKYKMRRKDRPSGKARS